MRARLAWAFALVAVTVMVLVALGTNLGMLWTMGRGMGPGHGSMMGGQGMGHGWGWQNFAGWPMRDLAQWSLGTGLAVVAAAALAGWAAAGRFTGPLAGLAQAARNLGPRDLGYRVPEPETGDEVGELAREFNRMAARLEREDAARRQMLADVAHELRHPVAVIQGQLELWQDGVRPVSAEHLAALQDEVLRLGRLIHDLEDLSLAEAGALTLDRQQVRPEAVVGPVLANFEPAAEAQGVTLEAALAPEAPAVLADPQRLRQVLVNLVSNALRHTPDGGRITVSAAGKAGGLELAVTDTGTGIAPEDLPHVFERFYKADRSRTRRGSGAGLGLAITRSLVQLHGGTIRAESAPGRGSRFVVELPGIGGADG